MEIVSNNFINGKHFQQLNNNHFISSHSNACPSPYELAADCSSAAKQERHTKVKNMYQQPQRYYIKTNINMYWKEIMLC